MVILLWILAVLNLLGGFVIGDEIRNMLLGISVGVVGFAILGGFATVIGLLQEIASDAAEVKNTLAITASRKYFNGSGNASAEPNKNNSSFSNASVGSGVNATQPMPDEEKMLKNGGWRCEQCGKIHEAYSWKCSCGYEKKI